MATHCRRWLTLAAVTGLLALAGAGYAVMHAASFLAFPRNEPVPADVAFVLGGGTGDRVGRAIDLHRAGLVKTFVVTGIEDSSGRARAASVEWRVRMLLDDGVPEASIIGDSRAT